MPIPPCEIYEKQKKETWMRAFVSGPFQQRLKKRFCFVDAHIPPLEAKTSLCNQQHIAHGSIAKIGISFLVFVVAPRRQILLEFTVEANTPPGQPQIMELTSPVSMDVFAAFPMR